jgi:hypothetical protein
LTYPGTPLESWPPSQSAFKDEISYEKIFESDLLRVLDARTPLEELVYPPQPEEEAEVLAEEPQQAADETNSALANQT